MFWIPREAREDTQHQGFVIVKRMVYKAYPTNLWFANGAFIVIKQLHHMVLRLVIHLFFTADNVNVDFNYVCMGNCCEGLAYEELKLLVHHDINATIDDIKAELFPMVTPDTEIMQWAGSLIVKHNPRYNTLPMGFNSSTTPTVVSPYISTSHPKGNHGSLVSSYIVVALTLHQTYYFLHFNSLDGSILWDPGGVNIFFTMPMGHHNANNGLHTQRYGTRVDVLMFISRFY